MVSQPKTDAAYMAGVIFVRRIGGVMGSGLIPCIIHAGLCAGPVRICHAIMEQIIMVRGVGDGGGQEENACGLFTPWMVHLPAIGQRVRHAVPQADIDHGLCHHLMPVIAGFRGNDTRPCDGAALNFDAERMMKAGAVHMTGPLHVQGSMAKCA